MEILTLKSKIDDEKKEASQCDSRRYLDREYIQLMLDKEFCDLTVVIETDIRCHRSILAKNGYLRAMLQSTSKETRENRVYLSNVKVEVF